MGGFGVGSGIDKAIAPPFNCLDKIWSTTCAVSTIEAILRHVIQQKKNICVKMNAFWPQKYRNVSLYSICKKCSQEYKWILEINVLTYFGWLSTLIEKNCTTNYSTFRLTSLWKLAFPGTLDITFDKCKAHNVDNAHNNAKVIVVGTNPDIWYKYGKFNIAGPVNELIAIATLPNIPIVPTYWTM